MPDSTTKIALLAVAGYLAYEYLYLPSIAVQPVAVPAVTSSPYAGAVQSTVQPAATAQPITPTVPVLASPSVSSNPEAVTPQPIVPAVPLMASPSVSSNPETVITPAPPQDVMQPYEPPAQQPDPTLPQSEIDAEPPMITGPVRTSIYFPGLIVTGSRQNVY